jgi:hypothetical protein
MTEALKFEVGGVYENMKGAYEVVSIQKDAMLIRWHNGGELLTSMELQKRIIERMDLDKKSQEQKEARRQSSSEKPSPKKAPPFVGFREEDFKRTAKNTTWRGRGSVGGAVIKALNSDQMDFGAWGLTTRPEVHWIEKLRHARKIAGQGIGFFARVDERNLFYGVYIQPANTTDNPPNGAVAFGTWLAQSENESWLKQVFTNNNLSLLDISDKVLAHVITCSGGHWEYKEGKTRHKIESLSAFLALQSNANLADLRIETKISKDDALTAGKSIVNTLCTLFQTLMPLYGVAPAIFE